MARVEGVRRLPRTAGQAEARLRAIEKEIHRILEYFPELRHAARPGLEEPARHSERHARRFVLTRVLH